MATVDQIQRVKQAIETIGREIGEIEGRKKRLVEDLAKQGFATLEDALKALPLMRRQLDALKKARDCAIQEFYRQYGQRLATTDRRQA